jgi:DNA (cytosine-5)-methyltransferase 1
VSCIDGGALFVEAERSRARRLADSPLGGVRPGEIVVDLFCGGGGATQGIEDAGLMVHECVNHCPTAIATHAENHPTTNHRRGDVWKNTPEAVAAGRPVAMLWASPDCRHFSRARGAAPVSRRVRDLAWVVTKWAASTAAPRVIIVENVPEFLEWGPTRARKDERGRAVMDEQGRAVLEPVPERKGQTFRRWRRMLERAGYAAEWRVLDAADFGAASRRKRLYVIARRDGQAVCWPEVTHGPRDLQGAGADHRDGGDGRRDQPGARTVQPQGAGRDGAQRPHRAAAEVIDWSDLGTSIFDRPRPLKPKTLARIAEGIRRYVLSDPAPFVLRVTQTGEGGGWKVRGVDEPLPTATTRQDLAVCTPIVAPQNSGVFGQRVDRPGPTITGKGHQSLITPVLATTGYGERPGQRPRCAAVSELLGTCVNAVKQGLVSPVLMSAGGPECRAVPASDPLGTVLPRDHRALVAPVLGVLRNHADAVPVTGPAPTVCSGGNHAALVAALLVKFYGAEKGGQDARKPLGTVTTRDRHGLVCVAIEGVEFVIVDILFRMLKPRELAAAMGFPAHYRWPATQRDAVRLIGNAVSPPQAAALVRANLPRGVIEGAAKRRAVA